jgi:protein disulfide-isomerase A6
MHHPTVVSTLAMLAALPFAQAGIYPKSSPVLQVEAKTYEKLIAKSNYTSVRKQTTPDRFT